MDFRKRAVAYKREGHTFKQLREAFGIPPETYYDRKKKPEDGCYDAEIKRERGRKTDKDVLRQAAALKPDAHLNELAVQFGCTGTAVFYALEKLKITRKKRPLPVTKNPKRTVPNIPKG